MAGTTLIIPAAGIGTRLGAGTAKALVPVNGLPMVIRLLRLYAPFVDETVVVAGAETRSAIQDAVGGVAQVAVQHRPTGMLDAILAAAPAVSRSSDAVWVTWCDQILVTAATVATLAEETASHPEALMVIPTVRRAAPYVHLERDQAGGIVRVRQKREGDPMPATGESDIGLFSLSGDAFRVMLPRFATGVTPGTLTGERNFLPFIPWVAQRGRVLTFPCTNELEAVGINTPEELAFAEAHLRAVESD